MGHMNRRAATANLGIIETGKVIMHQRGAVQQLDGGGGAQRHRHGASAGGTAGPRDSQ